MEDTKGVADEFVVERKESSFLKSSDFDTAQIVEVVKMEKFVPNKGKNGEDYGVKNTYGAGGVVTKEHWFIKNKILEEGESFKYTFKQNDIEKTFENSSLSFYFSFIKAELVAGDVVSIIRDNTNDKRPEWTIVKQ